MTFCFARQHYNVKTALYRKLPGVVPTVPRNVRGHKKRSAQVESDSMIGAGVTLSATSSLNVRSGPCTNKAVVRTVSAGTTMKTTGWSGSACGYTWYGVQGSFGTGYVASSFVKQGGSSPSPSPSPAPKPSPSGGSLSLSQLRAIMPNLSSAKASEYIGHLNDAMNWAGITTCPRRTAFLAQLAHESAQLRYMEEIASGAAYEGRKDLGNTQPGDGKRFKGRGPIQLTGRANYKAAGSALGVDFVNNPTIGMLYNYYSCIFSTNQLIFLVATPKWGFKVAGWYWKTRSLNSYADQNSQSSFDQITRRINGGYNGKADRDQYWRKAKSVLGC
jgi:predicted chitinase